MIGGNHAVYFNRFENYAVHVMRLSINETGESDLITINYQYRYKYDFIINNSLNDTK